MTRLNISKKLICLNAKGQFFSQDLILGIFFFLIVLTLFFVFSQNVSSTISYYNSSEKLNSTITNVNSTLILTPGVPSNWQEDRIFLDDINFFGLAYSKNILTEQKILKLAKYLDENYTLTKEKLGLGKYDFMFELTNLSTNKIEVTSGIISPNATSKIYNERIVIFNDSIYLFKGIISYGYN
ncbi:MAG: hypothetical protein PHQ98_02405 [Candidatus ainarchaeum sp.]|nr:hypothetical protein [Candidatus ainarchaeum sp.]